MTQTILYIEDGVDAFEKLLEMGESRIAGRDQQPPGQLVAGAFVVTYKLEDRGEDGYFPILAISRSDFQDLNPRDLHLPLVSLIAEYLGDPIAVQKHTIPSRGPTLFLIYKESRLNADGKHDRTKAAKRRVEPPHKLPPNG